ncbi:MAG: hypothetical protein HYX22_01210 [Candidatus Yanofskybacteria bacterium]|nr:hypothetical protein [Candidatus Yanofskybacteria bacterium]
MHIWIDSQLLRLASSLAEKFNWLTGKDNFWLSYQLMIISFITLVIAYYCLQLDSKGQTQMLAGIILTISISPLIKVMEITKSERQETKILELELYFLFIRLVLLLSVLGTFIRITYNEIYFFRCIWVTCSTLAFYLASIDNPPFSKSKAWEWLKDKVQFSFLPLNPIPINNR